MLAGKVDGVGSFFEVNVVTARSAFNSEMRGVDFDVGKVMGILIQLAKDSTAGDRAGEGQVFGD